MSDRIGGVPVLRISADGPALGTEADALDLIGAAGCAGAEMVVLPACRLAPAFLQLESRLAGAFLQKLANYGVRLAIVGDLSEALENSRALRDFVRESNRGRQIWFVTDELDLARRLAASPTSG